jgi:hypothetical protein
MMTLDTSQVLLNVALLWTHLAYVNQLKVLLAKVIITNVPLKRIPGSFKGNIGMYTGWGTVTTQGT